MEVKEFDFLNLDESPTDMPSTFKASGVDNRTATDIDESQQDAPVEDPMHILSLIEKNEKLNEAVPDEVI